MSFYKANWILLPIFAFTISSILSQTLIINEVSNGPSGNQEYVEFVVVSNTAVYNCSSDAPPCIDIRGWIFDDNSGYHGTSGVAAGAVRFSQDPLWACVPLGTIILIYNNADPNSSIPGSDLSLLDGNCTIIAPINNPTLFESNASTPGAVACSYPALGWTTGGNWNNTLLANSGDCARIVDLSGCEVFSLCWASDNLNNLIYFNSGGSGTDQVWSFNDGDPNLQANWSEGCTDPSTCGSNNQTPGTPNNAANAGYIAQFNNGCLPIEPLTLIPSLTNPTCGCDGIASIAASGSVPEYSYEWFDATMNPLGETTTTANNLCAGTYIVSVTSSIGCTATSSITLTNSNPTITPTFSQVGQYCAGESIAALPTSSTNVIAGSWAPAINNSNTTTYTFTPTSTATPNCTTTATMTITIVEIPQPNFTISPYNPCIPATIQLNNISNVGGNCQWALSNSDIYSGCIGPEIILNEPGCYDVTLYIDMQGCIGSFFVENAIFVTASPIAAFEMSVQTVSELEPMVQFFNNSIDSELNYWTFGDGSFSNIEDPFHTYDNINSESYQTCLIVAQDNCTDTTCQDISTTDDLFYFVPNTFTPDNDEYNNIFKPTFSSGFDPENYMLLIFDRWGEIVFEAKDINVGWNGLFNSRQEVETVQEGTYTWKIQFKKKNTDNNKEIVGHVNLIR